MEEQGKYGKAWTEGFAKAAMANGADADTTKQLLKVAAFMDKVREPEFIDGFNKAAEDLGVDKEALLSATLEKEAGLGGVLAGGLGAMGLMGAGGALSDWWRRSHGRGQYGRQYYDLMDLSQRGAISPEEATALLRNTMTNRARGNLSLLGADDGRGNPYEAWFRST